MVKLTPTGVKINTNLVWTSHNTRGVEFNTGVFALYILSHAKYPQLLQDFTYFRMDKWFVARS